jgi:hypothetical protein
MSMTKSFAIVLATFWMVDMTAPFLLRAYGVGSSVVWRFKDYGVLKMPRSLALALVSLVVTAGQVRQLPAPAALGLMIALMICWMLLAVRDAGGLRRG